jgi:signal transduction histidine kinase
MNDKIRQVMNFKAEMKFYNFLGRKLNLKTAIFRSDISRKAKIKRLLFAYCALSVLILMTIFTMAYLMKGFWFMGSFVFFCGCFYFYVLFFGFRKYRNTEKLILVNSILMGILLLCVLANSAPSGYVGLWLFIFPPFLYFIQDAKNAVILNGFFFMGILVILLAGDVIPWAPRFENAFRFRFLVTMGVMMMVAFMSELIRSGYEQRMFRHYKKLEKEKDKLARAKKLVEKASQAKSDFLANMSHELRTPLNHIIGFTELVADKSVGDLNETQEEYLKDALVSAKHLFGLIHDTLEMAKADSGRLDFEPSPVDVRSLVENSIAEFGDQARKKEIRITTDITRSPGIIQADKAKLKKVLNNLLSNALKYSPVGGEIRIDVQRAKKETPGEQGLHSQNQDSYIEISVRDNGVGIQKEDLGRILNPFEQVESGTSRRYSGTGLGLALARRLVALHKGRIWSESEGPGKGATFHVLLPEGSEPLPPEVPAAVPA